MFRFFPLCYEAPAMRSWLKSFSFVVLALGLLGCKQGEGEVCQINDDCQEGLECNAGTRRCQKPGTVGTPDASVDEPDAAVDEPDAAVNTAAVQELDVPEDALEPVYDDVAR